MTVISNILKNTFKVTYRTIRYGYQVWKTAPNGTRVFAKGNTFTAINRAGKVVKITKRTVDEGVINVYSKTFLPDGGIHITESSRTPDLLDGGFANWFKRIFDCKGKEIKPNDFKFATQYRIEENKIIGTFDRYKFNNAFEMTQYFRHTIIK